ncbi:hypothetical protein [Paludisphaera soli]|uniref:hypothetical protein n=1 Tax=Paludisphaera soli TaxID=2712865 RepID=UPI0013EB38F6|nr:hypothetical protein [Paludisphaera soli]
MNPEHPAYDPRYLAKLEPPAPGPEEALLASLAPYIKAAAACPHRGPARGACGCHWCSRDGIKVTPPECWACRKSAATA